MTVINMQLMRYINLLDRVSHVKTMKCYLYNNCIVFAVPKIMVARAIGHNAENIRYMSQQIGKRIKVIAQTEGLTDAQRFISDIVSPVGFNEITISDGVLTLNAGSQSKAALIGRERRREQELHQIIKDTFGLDLKIV